MLSLLYLCLAIVTYLNMTLKKPGLGCWSIKDLTKSTYHPNKSFPKIRRGKRMAAPAAEEWVDSD